MANGDCRIGLVCPGVYPGNGGTDRDPLSSTQTGGFGYAGQRVNESGLFFKGCRSRGQRAGASVSKYEFDGSEAGAYFKDQVDQIHLLRSEVHLGSRDPGVK